MLAAMTAVLGGLVLGIGTQMLQGELPGSWNVLANSGVAWAAAAAGIGAVMPSRRSAALGGAAALVLASVSYYWAVEWLEGGRSHDRSTVIWSLAGVAAGLAFGAIGYLVRADRERRWLALAVAAGVVLAEGLYFWRYVPHLRPAASAELVIAAVLVGLCLGRDRRALGVVGLAATGVVLAAIAGVLIDAGFRLPA